MPVLGWTYLLHLEGTCSCANWNGTRTLTETFLLKLQGQISWYFKCTRIFATNISKAQEHLSYWNICGFQYDPSLLQQASQVLRPSDPQSWVKFQGESQPCGFAGKAYLKVQFTQPLVRQVAVGSQLHFPTAPTALLWMFPAPIAVLGTSVSLTALNPAQGPLVSH